MLEEHFNLFLVMIDLLFVYFLEPSLFVFEGTRTMNMTTQFEPLLYKQLDITFLTLKDLSIVHCKYQHRIFTRKAKPKVR